MKKFNLLALLVFAGLMAWVFLMDTPTTRAVQNRIGAIFAPFKRTGAEVQNAMTGASDEKRTPEQLRAENLKLRQERDELAILRNETPRLQQELKRLNALLGFQNRTDFKLIPARVIVRKTSAWARQATIDKGSLQGVQDGSPVILPYGESGNATALVGRVTRSNENEADIVFVTDELCKVGARIEGADERMRGILEGARVSTEKRSLLRLRYLPRDTTLPRDEQNHYKPLKVYSWNNNRFPANLLLGTIVDFRPGDSTSEAIVEPAINLDDLPYVFVMEQKLEDPPPSNASPR